LFGCSKARIVGSHDEPLCFADHELCGKGPMLLGRCTLRYWHYTCISNSRRALALLMRYSLVIPIAVCWATLAGLGVSDLSAGVTSMPQESPGTSAGAGQGTGGEPKQIQLPPAGEPPQQLTPEERQRLEQAVEGTHLPGPKPSKGPAVQPEPGPQLVPPTSPRTLPGPDEGESGGR